MLGSHYENVDSSDFPFSYLIEHHEHKTRLIPGMNLFGIGLCRDEIKWQNRDRRKGNKKDFITFDVFTPYTVSKMIKAEDLLFTFIKENIAIGDISSYFVYNKMYIKKSSLQKYIGLYTLAIDLYLHNKLLQRISCKSFEEMRAKLRENNSEFFNNWVDIASLIMPKDRVDNIIWALENNEIKTTGELSAAWAKVHSLYADDEWAWISHIFNKRYMINFSSITAVQMKSILENHKLYLKESQAIFENDARKEFSISKQISSGVDDVLVRKDDFEAARGTVDSNTFVIKYREMMKEKLADIESIFSILN